MLAKERASIPGKMETTSETGPEMTGEELWAWEEEELH